MFDDYETTGDLNDAIHAERLDADMEMAELQRAADENAAAIKAGNCPHGWTGPVDHADPDEKRFRCNNCGHIFADVAERDAFLDGQYGPVR